MWCLVLTVDGLSGRAFFFSSRRRHTSWPRDWSSDVCSSDLRSGGRIGLANWTPEGFVGQMFKVLGRHVAPPSGVEPPALWGVESHLRSLFGEDAAAITVTRRLFNFRYRSAAHFIDVFRSWYGPVHKAFAALSADKAQLLERDLNCLLKDMNRAGPASLI